MLVMGLNNYSQMGIDHTKSGLTFFMPVVSDDLSSRDWQHIAIGQHHTLGLDTAGKVHCIGRADYGRLGLGEGATDIGKVECLYNLSQSNFTSIHEFTLILKTMFPGDGGWRRVW